VAGMCPLSQAGVYASLTAQLTTHRQADPETGVTVLTPSSELWMEMYKTLYSGRKFQAMMGSGIKVTVSSSGQISATTDGGLNPPITMAAIYHLTPHWSVIVGLRTTRIDPTPEALARNPGAKGWWNAQPAVGFMWTPPAGTVQ